MKDSSATALQMTSRLQRGGREFDSLSAHFLSSRYRMIRCLAKRKKRKKQCFKLPLIQQWMSVHYAAAKAAPSLTITWSVLAAGTYLLRGKDIWKKNRISVLHAVQQNNLPYLGMMLNVKNAGMFINQDSLGSYHITSSTS